MCNYKEILDDILELDKSIVVVQGFGDIVSNSDGVHIFGDIKNSLWIVFGRAEIEYVSEVLSEYECNVDRDGEYGFNAVLKWYPADADEYGRITMPGFLDVKYIEYDFYQTFQQRDRQAKLDEIVDDFNDLFNL